MLLKLLYFLFMQKNITKLNKAKVSGNITSISLTDMNRCGPMLYVHDNQGCNLFSYSAEERKLALQDFVILQKMLK